MLIGDKIRQQRREIGITQENLSEKMGVSLKTIQRWESGIRSPRMEEINKLADKLQTTTGYLMGLEDKPEKPEITSGIDNDDVELGFWGTVADKARKLARIGNREDISAALFMLKMAVSSLDKAAAAAV